MSNGHHVFQPSKRTKILPKVLYCNGHAISDCKEMHYVTNIALYKLYIHNDSKRKKTDHSLFKNVNDFVKFNTSRRRRTGKARKNARDRKSVV